MFTTCAGTILLTLQISTAIFEVPAFSIKCIPVTSSKMNCTYKLGTNEITVISANITIFFIYYLKQAVPVCAA